MGPVLKLLPHRRCTNAPHRKHELQIFQHGRRKHGRDKRRRQEGGRGARRVRQVRQGGRQGRRGGRGEEPQGRGEGRQGRRQGPPRHRRPAWPGAACHQGGQVDSSSSSSSRGHIQNRSLL